MATEQDTKELSMAEILSSIRQILEENGAGETAPKKREEDDEVLELNPSMIIEEEEEEKTPFAPAFVAQDNVSQSKPEQKLFVQAKPLVEEKQNICASPYDMMQNTQNMPSVENNLQEDIEKTKEKTLPEAEKMSDVSKEIINSFTKMFEKNDFGYHKNIPSFDAEALLKQIIRQAVEEKLDNHVLLDMVTKTVVPVLEAWLSYYLPKMVAEEVKRVMAKAGKY